MSFWMYGQLSLMLIPDSYRQQSATTTFKPPNVGLHA
jgi:hypothetical protein